MEGLRKLCDTHQSLLIFDEVMTGFRLAKGGAQESLQVAGDIMTFGKVLGGGLPVGAFAANSAIMDFLAPEGPVYQAGTLSGNPLAMAAGFAMLNHLSKNPEVFDSLNRKTQTLHQGMQEILEKKGNSLPNQPLWFYAFLTFYNTARGGF